jgi:hypothetical protein
MRAVSSMSNVKLWFRKQSVVMDAAFADLIRRQYTRRTTALSVWVSDLYLFTILENDSFFRRIKFNDIRYLPFLLFILLFTKAIKQDAPAPPSQINPTMILILIVMALMFIIICVVLRLFSK